MTDQFNPINVWNKHKYEDRIESVNDESDNLRDGSKFSGATEEHNNDRLQRSSSLDQQPSLAETQREPVNVLPSDFGGYVLHPEHTSNQDSAFKQGADDMISRDQQKQPGGFDFHSMKTEQPAKPTSPPGYQAKPALTHDKDISFFGDCNVATEYQPASRSTLDQDGLHRGSISTLPSAGTGRRASATSTGRRASATSTGRRASANKQSQNISTGKITGSAAKDGGRRPSLMDMATAAVTSVGAVGAAAASGVSSAFMGNNRSPTGYSNVVKNQSSMPSSWPSSSAADNDNGALGISSSISAYPEGPDAKNATNCYYEPAIHGQTACFYTKDDVCNECTEDAEHPFCKHVQEPSIHGQCPSFYCDEKLNDDVFMPHLPVTNVEQSFAAKSQSPRSSLTIDDLPHGFPNHAELPVTNVEQCLNPLDDQINQSSLDKGMSDNNLDQAALPVSNVEQSSKYNDQAPQASLNSDTLNNNNTDQAALPVDNVDQTTSQRSPTNDNGQIGKGLLAGGVGAGAGAGAAIGGLLSNKNKAGNLDTQEQSQGLNNTSQGATSDGLTSTPHGYDGDNDNSALGISSSISAYPEGPDAKNATNCYYEPAIHGQTACFYTKDDVCNECTEDAEHPFCKHVQEPSIHGQCPSFYCDEKLNDDVFMPHLPVTNVEQSFAAKSQSPRSSLTIDDLPHGFPNHAELPVTNVEQCLNPLDDQINQSSLDKGMSDNNLDQAALPVSNVEQSSKSNDQAPQASLNSDTLNNNNTDQAALPVDNVDQTTSQRSPTNDNGQIGKGLLAGGVGAGAGAGAAIGGLLSNKNKAGNLDTQEQSQGLNNSSQGATSDGLTSTTVQPNLEDSQLYEKQDDTTVPQDRSKGNDQDAAAASQTLDNDKNNQDFSDAPQNWVDEQSSAEDGSDLPQTWGDQTIPVAPHLSTDSPTGGKRAVSSTPHGYDGDKSITAVPPVGIAGENQSYNPQLSTDTQNYDNQAFQSDQDLVNNFAAGTKTDDQPNKGLLATGGAAAGATLGGALNLGHGNDKKTNNLQQSNVQGQDVTTAPQTLAGSNEPIDTSDSQKWSTDNDQTQGWLSNDDQAVTNDPQTLLGNNDQALLTGDDQGLHGANQDDQGITTAPHTIATGNDKDITAGTQGWSNDTNDQGIITASQAAAIDKGQDVTTSAPWTDNKVDQGNATVPKTWNDQSVSTASNDQDAPAVAEGGISQDVSTSPQTLDSTSNTGGDMNNKSRAEEGLLAGGIGGVGAAAATAGGVLGMDKHKQNKGEGARIDNESFSSTRATAGKIVPDYRNQDEVKDRPMERHENFKGVTDSIDSNRHIQPNTKRKNSLTQSFKAKAAASSAAVTGAFSNAVRRLSSQGSSGSIKKDSIHVRRMSDAEVFKNQTLQDEHPGEQKAFGNYEQTAFGGNATFGNTSGIPPAPTVLHTAANTTDVPFAHDQNAIRTGASAPMDQEHDVIYPAAATATAGVPLSSEENALRPQASNNYDSSAVPAGDNLNETGGIKRTSSDRLKYTGVNQAYARIPGVHSMKPTGTADNGDANFIKNEEERRTTPNMSTFVSGHVETRRGSIQKTVGRIFRSGSMQDKGALKQISGQEKINAYNATHNKL